MEIDYLKSKKTEFEKKLGRMIFDFEREIDVEITKINVEKHGFFAGDRITTVNIEIRL